MDKIFPRTAKGRTSGHLALCAALLLAAACAPSRPARPIPVPDRPASIPSAPAPVPSAPSPPAESAAGEPLPGNVTNPTRPASNYGQDAVACERKAALSHAGGKGEAFAACMRARGYSTGR